jgi:hypothetical protein
MYSLTMETLRSKLLLVVKGQFGLTLRLAPAQACRQAQEA